MALDLKQELEALTALSTAGVPFAICGGIAVTIQPDGEEFLTLDLIVVGGSLTGVWDDRILVIWDDHEVPVVSRDGLAIMRRLAGRPKDLLDIAALEGTDVTNAKPIDMSPTAVSHRLQTLANLYRLARSLATAKIVGPIKR